MMHRRLLAGNPNLRMPHHTVPARLAAIPVLTTTKIHSATIRKDAARSAFRMCDSVPYHLLSSSQGADTFCNEGMCLTVGRPRLH